MRVLSQVTVLCYALPVNEHVKKPLLDGEGR